MHYHDLIETLDSLKVGEQKRLLNFLNLSKGERSSGNAPDETKLIIQHSINTLNTLRQADQPEKVFKHVLSNEPFDPKKWDSILRTTIVEVRNLIKQKLNKRLPADEKDMVVLLRRLTPSERSKLIQFITELPGEDAPIILRTTEYYRLALKKFEDQLSLDAMCTLLEIQKKDEQAEREVTKIRSNALKKVRRLIALEIRWVQIDELAEQVAVQSFFQKRLNSKQYRQARTAVHKLYRERTKIGKKEAYLIFLSELSEYEYLSNANDTTSDQNLWETIRRLDEYYLIEKMWLACQLLNINKISPLALPPLKDWMHFDIHASNLRWFFDKPLGRLFKGTFRLLLEENDVTLQEFKQFIELLNQYADNIDPELIACFEIIAINHGIRRINSGKLQEYRWPVFAIQQLRAESGRILLDGVILAREFQSITTLGLLVNQNEWVHKFIETNKHLVAGTMSSLDYYQFCLALYWYHIGNKLEALQVLMNNDFDDLQCEMASRVLEVKILYELDLDGTTKLRVSDQLDLRIEAGILYFFRLKGVTVQMRTLRKRFMDAMKKIIRAKDNRKWNILKKIRKNVETIDYIAERPWLLGTIDRILENKK